MGRPTFLCYVSHQQLYMYCPFLLDEINSLYIALFYLMKSTLYFDGFFDFIVHSVYELYEQKDAEVVKLMFLFFGQRNVTFLDIKSLLQTSKNLYVILMCVIRAACVKEKKSV